MPMVMDGTTKLMAATPNVHHMCTVDIHCPVWDCLIQNCIKNYHNLLFICSCI